MNDFTAAAELLKQQQTGAVSPLARAAETMKAQQAGQVGMALTYDERDPDAEAKSRQVGAALGINPVVVGADPEAYDLQLRMKQAADGLRQAPKTAAWLADRENGVLAKDDLDNLTWWERVLNAPSQGLVEMGDAAEGSAAGRMIERGVRRIPMAGDVLSVQGTSARIADVGRSLDDLIAEELAQVGGDSAPAPMRSMALMAAQVRFDAARDLSPEDVRRLLDRGSAALLSARERSDKIASIPMSGPATAFRDETLANAEDTFLGALGAFASDPIRGAAFAAEVAGEFLPAILGASAVTVVTRSPAAGALTLGTVSGLTENAASTMEFLAERGVRMETPEDAMAALQDADLMQAARDRGLTRGLVIGMMDAISGGVAGKTLAKSPIGDVILQGIAQVGFGAGGEALAQVGAGQQVSWKDIVIEGLAELATAPIEVLGVGGRRLLRSSVKAVKAGDTAAALADVDLQAMASKLRARAPDKFMAALEAQGLGDKAVYVPADALKEYFQAKDVALDEETMRAWGIDPLTFEEAAQSGNDVAIPMANYATHIAGTDAAAWIAENATSDPEEMSIAAVKAFNASVQDIMQEAYDQAERARLADEELRASDVQIYDQMFSQLRAAGRSPDVAQNEARIWSAFWRTMGERYGEDPLDLARSMGVQVRGPQSPEFRRRDALDIALNTLRTKGERALKPRGMSLAEFVKSKGGIQDTGGDVAAMEPPKGVVAETSKEIRARQSQPTLDAMPATGKGMSLEDMGRMAAEAGYFPDLMGEVNAATNKGEATDFAARLLEALSEDVAGRKVYVEGEGPDAGLQALSDALSERGIDLAAMSNDEIVAALEAADGQTYNQGVTQSDVDALAESIKADLNLRDLSMFLKGDGDLKLNMIAVAKGEQGRGSGTEAMQRITDFADANGLRVLLTPGLPDDGFGTTSRARLVKFYKRFGFVENKGRNKDFAISEGMYREPVNSRALYQSAPLKTDTPEFAAWFGDSKVVDENGKPLVVYHGTGSDIAGDEFAFKPELIGSATDGGHYGRGFYFTPSKGEAEYYGGNVGAFYISIQNPLDLTNTTGDFTFIGHFKSFGQKLDAIGALSEDQKQVLTATLAADAYVVENVKFMNAVAQDGSEGWTAKVANPAEGFTNEIHMRPMMRGNWPATQEEALQRLQSEFRSEMERFHSEVFPGLGAEHASLSDYVRTELGPDALTEAAMAAGYDGIVYGDEYVAFRPTQIKSTSNRGTFDPNDPRILYQPAYHGSPHIFDKFSTDKIGTGEGAQAFGWGLYFAGRKGVAEYYRDTLSQRSFTLIVGGERIGTPEDRNTPFADYTARQRAAVRVAQSIDEGMGVDHALLWARNALRSAEIGDLTKFQIESGWGDVEKLREVVRIIEGWRDADIKIERGRLYKVDIPEDSDLLAWDAPLSEQSEKVRGKIEKLLEGAKIVKNTSQPHKPDIMIGEKWVGYAGHGYDGGTTIGYLRGDRIYTILSILHDGAKGASEALRNAGIPGHRFLDQGSRGQGDGSYNYVIYDDSAVSVLEFEQGKRGSIVLPSGGLTEGQTVINLFESADLSTALHEFGHFFLEAFSALASTPEASQSMRDDLATIRDFLGVKDGAALTTEQHEKWARGFESYLMEGKAPSLALADAFARFKAWLTRIYKTALGLNVNITPEIREVMDRMLATDAEIAAARQEQSMSPLFTSAPPGMSDTDFSTYQRMARRATETAEQALLEKTMAKVRREKEAWYRDEKQATRAEVAAEYDRRREYRLIDMLANQLWHGLDENGEARTVPDVQIDRKMLVDQFGDGVLAEISRNRLGGKRAIYGDNGSSPEEVAQFFGFASASEMISVLQNTPKKRDAVAMETERRMTERHGDPLNDGSIEEEALAAIHNEQQANTAVAEARHMARQLGRPVNGMTAKLYRQRARAMIGRMAVRDAIRVERFLASERKAARAAQDAFAKVARGTKAEAALAEALQAKEQQILNGFLYDEARQIAAEVQRGREKMRAYDKKSVREKLEGGYIEQIDAILADYDFRVRSQRQIARAESLKAFVDRMIEEGREGDLHIDMRLMDEAHRKHYTRLSVDDLRGLFDTIDNIDHLGRFKQKLIDRKRRRDLAESASRVAGQVRENIGAGKAGEKSRLAAAFNLLWRTDTLLARMDGGQEIGPAYDEIKRGIDEAVSEEQAMHVDMAKRLDGLFRDHYSAADLRKMKVERDIPGGNGRAWSKMEILAVALNTGNEDNFARLTANDAAVRNRLAREHVDALLATLDENDWRFVQGMWDMVNSYWPGLAEVAKRRTGVAPKKVEAKLMVNAPAFVTGGYFPIKYDPELSAAAATDEASGWDKFTATGRGATAAVRNGMTMQRQKTGNGRTLRLDMSVAFAHMRDTIRYIALSEAVDNTYRLVSHPDVVNAFLDAGAKDQHTILRLWLKDVASGPAPSPDALNTASRILKNNFTLSRLALNFKTVALQVTGVGQSAVVIGKRNMIRGYMEYLQNPYGTAQSVVEKSAFMKERQSTFQKDIYDFMDDTQISGPLSSGYKKAKSVLAKIGFAPIVWTQFWAVDMPTWLGAFRTGIEKYGDEAKAIHFADRMVARAQDSGLMADRAAFERGTLSESVRQSDFVRLFTTLGGYMLTKMNRAYVLSMQTKADFRSADTGAQKVAIALSAATDVALLYLTEAVLVALVFAAMSDDEDDEDVAKFLLRETGSAAVGGMPLIRDAYAGLMGYGGGGIYGSLAEAPANFIRQVAQGENDAALRRSIADMIGMVTGLPTTGPMRAIEGALNDDVPLSEAVFGRNPLGR